MMMVVLYYKYTKYNPKAYVCKAFLFGETYVSSNLIYITIGLKLFVIEF